MNRRRVAIVLVLSLGLLSSTAAATVIGDAHATVERVPPDRCLKISSGLLSTLNSSLKPEARGKLGLPAATKSRQEITNGPRGFLKGVYFVSARVGGFGIATWAADASALKTGGGFVTGIGAVGRRVSVLGIDVPPSTLRGWHLHEETHGYAASRRCIYVAGPPRNP